MSFQKEAPPAVSSNAASFSFAPAMSKRVPHFVQLLRVGQKLLA
jgi:hypothetical protein